MRNNEKIMRSSVGMSEGEPVRCRLLEGLGVGIGHPHGWGVRAEVQGHGHFGIQRHLTAEYARPYRSSLLDEPHFQCLLSQ